jgi:alpha-methylacyl-CoA racemase
VPFLSLYTWANTSRVVKNPNAAMTALSGMLPNYRVYETKDGKYVMLAALEEKFFRTFCARLTAKIF